MTEKCRLDCTKHHEKYNNNKRIHAIRALFHKLNEKISENLIIILDLKIKVFLSIARHVNQTRNERNFK